VTGWDDVIIIDVVVIIIIIKFSSDDTWIFLFLSDAGFFKKS